MTIKKISFTLLIMMMLVGGVFSLANTVSADVTGGGGTGCTDCGGGTTGGGTTGGGTTGGGNHSNPPICNVSLSASAVSIGDKFTLTWNGTPSSGVFKINNYAVADSGSAEYTFPEGFSSIRYVMTGENSDGNCVKEVVVTKKVTEVTPTCEATLSATAVAIGGQYTLTWAGTPAAATFKINGTTVADSGSKVYTFVGPNTETFTFTGQNGSKTCSKTVTVSKITTTPAPVCVLTINPSSVNVGGTAKITWTSTNAVTGTINNGVGSVNPNNVDGFRNVNPTVNTTYTMTVTNSAGVTATCSDTVTVTTVTNPAPICDSFTASPTSIVRGNSSSLNWNTTNASSVNINNGVGSVSVDGNYSVSPIDSTTYLLTATLNGQTVTCPVTVNVTTPSNDVFTCANNVNFSASDTSITRGDSTNLSWNTTGATSVSINNGVNSTALDGSESVRPSDDITYTLNASNGRSTISCPLSINVDSPTSRSHGSSAPRCDLNISATSIALGDRVTIKWDTSYVSEVVLKDNFGKTLIDTNLVITNDRSDLYDGELTVRPEKDTTYTLRAARGSSYRNCEVSVDVRDTVVVTQVRDQQPLVSGIALTQVPYTGFEAGPVMASVFYTLLAAWALYMAYVLVGRRKSNLSEFTPAVVATETTVPASLFAESITTAPVFHNSNTESVIASTATVGYEAHSMITDAIEAQAHAQKVQLSHDAIAYFVAATNETDRTEILANLLTTAKASYPSEDGWVTIDAERMTALANS